MFDHFVSAASDIAAFLFHLDLFSIIVYISWRKEGNNGLSSVDSRYHRRHERLAAADC